MEAQSIVLKTISLLYTLTHQDEKPRLSMLGQRDKKLCFKEINRLVTEKNENDAN